MARRCDRPGCSEPVDVAYGFDATRRLVWLDRLVDDDRARAGALCARHAGRLTAPQGWWLDDRRVEVPDLFHEATPVPPPPAAEPRPPRRSRRRRTPSSADLTPVAAGEPAPVPPPPPPPPPPPAVAEPAPEADVLVPFTGFEADEDPVLAEGVVTVEETIVVEGGGMVEGAVAIEGAIVVEDDSGPPNALLTPSSPLLARAFTGAALPEPKHHRSRRNGTETTEPPAAP